MTYNTFSLTEEILAIQGMTCTGCAVRIEQALQKLKGISKADVNHVLERATISYNPVLVTIDDIIATVRSVGYDAKPYDALKFLHAEPAAHLSARRTRIELMIVMLVTTPLVVGMIPGADRLFPLSPWMALILATFVQLIGGLRFYVGAWKAVTSATANMDVLVVLGTTTAYLYSAVLVIRHGQEAEGLLYFEAAAVIITLVLFGKALEAAAQRRTTQALQALMHHRPEFARVVHQNEVIDVPIEQVRVHDIVIVKPGEYLPVDGRILNGVSEIDESMLTGEPLPVLHHIGDTVSAGCINGAGVLRIQASAVGKDSTLAKIIDLVEKALSGKAPIQRFVDRISAIFVPTVIVIAILAWGVWWFGGYGLETSLMVAVSVLVISCPCALGLATPTALVVGIGAGSRAGILIRDIKTLELAHRLDVLMFDKTGTLTQGKPSVVSVHPLRDDIDESCLLGLAAAVQSGSEHPLATAILSAAQERNVIWSEAQEIQSHPGAGIVGRVDGTTVTIGNRAFMRHCSIDITHAEPILRDQEHQGRTSMMIAQDGRMLGIIALADQLRPEAAPVIAHLKRQGLRVALLSGDNNVVATTVARAVGIDTVYAPVRPEEKLAIIDQWKAQGHTVGMIGDGVNDGPALACADVGIALGSGTDVAIHASGITLMRSDLRFIEGALDISRMTWNKIRQNLFWAFFYNILALPIASFGLLNPIIAGAAMALSSVSVVTNSLRLRAWSPTVK